MATFDDGDGIKPAPRPSSPPRSPWESTPPTFPVQERAISTVSVDIDGYYDIMVVGMSGMGKSTTSDKIVTAKIVEQRQLDGASNNVAIARQQDPRLSREYKLAGRDPHLKAGQQDPRPNSELAEHQIEGDEPMLIVKERKAMMHDLTFWTACGLPEGLKERVGYYLKNLHFYSELDDSHEEINKSRKDGDTNPVTSSCQLVSNEVSRMRVLDVPGFFGMQTEDSAPIARQSVSLLEQDIHKCAHNHLGIMREILRVQSTMNMAFRRILYFLPGRGPLGRQNSVLRQDLLLLAQYFGPAIFECMILIATVQPRWSVMTIPGGLFSDEECDETRLIFKRTLEDIMSSYPHRIPLSPPVVFISLLDTGMGIIEKVQNAPVHEECLELTFDPGVCVQCAITIQWLEKEKVGCVPVGGSGSDVIPYNDSFCHPIFLPRNRRPHKIEVEGGVTYIVLSASEEGRGAGSEEICLNCKRPPGSEGCMKVGKMYPMQMVEGEDKKIAVDHSNHIEEHRGLYQSAEVDQNEGAGLEGGGAERGAELEGSHDEVFRKKGGSQRCSKRGGGRDKEGHGNLLVEERKEEENPPASMAEDDGNATSELVVPNRRSKDTTNSHRPYEQSRLEQSLLEQSGLANVKGT